MQAGCYGVANMKNTMNPDPATGNQAGSHTPGPWRVVSTITGDTEVWSNGPHYCVADCNSKQSSCDIGQCEANARLISAAPELLQALKAFAVWTEGQPCFCDCEGWDRNQHGGQCSPNCRQARQAIAKATGAHND